MSAARLLVILFASLSTLRADAEPARAMDLGGVPFTNVMDFESPTTDRVYITGKVKFEKSAAFTGKYGISIPAGQSIRVRMGAALIGREFPGRWKYFGFHAQSSSPARLRVRWHDAGLAREALSVDVDKLSREWIELFAPADLGKLELELINESAEQVSIGIDDFILCDPELVVQQPDQSTIGLERTQLGWYLESKEGRIYAGRWDPMSGGVRPIENSPLRVIFMDARGKQFSFDSNGLRRPTIDPEALLDFTVLDESARIDRNSAGDSDQDGYDESSGSYQIHALLPTVSLRASPKEKSVDRSMLEIVNLPPGEVRVTVEGQLVERVHRFPDGRVLIELPITIDRPTLIEIRPVEVNPE